VRLRVGGTVSGLSTASYRFTNVPVGVPLQLWATYSGLTPHLSTARVNPVGWSNGFVVGIGQELRRDLRVTFVPAPGYRPAPRPGLR
jgi:hypothetical protein